MYDYRCHQCGETFEVIQKFADEPLKTHEGCGGEVERLISLPALQFKGTGWYVTDYGKGGKSPASSSESKADKADKKADTKTESKTTESKTESKTETKPAAPASSSTDK